MQVELGVVNYINLSSTATFVLAESWPACSFVANSLGHTNIYTYVESLSLQSKDVLKKTEIGSSLMPGPAILQKFEASTQSDECWIQGCAEFAERMATQLVTSRGSATIYIILCLRMDASCLRCSNQTFPERPSHTSKLEES